ncbi:MAG: hypothetical protein NTV86_05655 [Planctomycetota bacterium]|nr:hypothetical protein [Planctomycetota bacterium]
MFRLDILQNQWLLVAMALGLALVLAISLAFLAIWRPRGGAPPPRAVPWIVVVVLAATAAFAVTYVALAAVNPPTW